MTNPKHHQPGRSENVPFQRLVASTEQAAKAVAPLMKCATCANLEFVSLAGRRAKAYLDIPNEIAQCRGPQDLIAAQARFWQAMLRDYAEYAQRLVTAMQAFDGEVAASESRERGARERDMLTFPNVFGFPAWQLPASPTKDRAEEDRAA
ncbi:MAG: phasin family protein [Hyphomicrobiaceae bacterium]